MKLRVLGEGDQDLLEAFLQGRRDSSMFLRSNLRGGGIVFRGEPFQATYAAAFDGERLCGVIAHTWSGMIITQAGEHAAELARFIVAESGRKVTGFLGQQAQVDRARAVLALQEVPTKCDKHDGLYGLDLADRTPPAALVSGAVSVRGPLPEERATLIAWRIAYNIEILGGEDTPEDRERATTFFEAQWPHMRVAVVDDRAVSLSAFNAVLPDIVQLGGIYTPPELRGRGYARASVAGSLELAVQRGATRCVLFTETPSAIRCYESLGFQRIGDYALVLLP